MDIHHAMIVHTPPNCVYQALTQPHDLEIWMGAPTLARAEVGAAVEFHYDPGHSLKMEITRLEPGNLVQWRVVQPMWPGDAADQFITWNLAPYEVNTLLDFRMSGWKKDDDVLASVSYKWASFMMLLKIFLGDTREVAAFLPIIEKNVAAGK